MTQQAQRRIRETIGSVYAFVRSREANRALASVTFEQLIAEQIARNGETESLNKNATSDSATPEGTQPATQTPINTTNFVSGTDINIPSKIEQLDALQSELEGLVEVIKQLDPDELRDPVQEDEESSDPITTAKLFEETSLGEGF